MKLNYKKTIFVGFAFFLICTFWQAYDTIIPKILTDKFGMSQSISGAVMALDNILALFLLPIFGAISDRCHSKLGRRTPFILIGTIIAAVVFVGLSFADNMQLSHLGDVASSDNTKVLETLYDNEYNKALKTPDGTEYVIREKFTREQFTSIEKNSKDYSDYVVPARQSYAWQQTVKNPTALIFFAGLLLIVLVAMGIFRSPAVALMPDVTIKPLRSKANAIINLMGTAGGIVVLVLGMIFKTGSADNALMSYTVFFSAIAAIMLGALVIFMLTVREPKLVREMEEDSKRLGLDDEGTDDSQSGGKKLSKSEFTSLILILASVVLWFMGYNAVTSKYSVYAGKVLALDYNLTLIIAQAAAVIAYIPVGIISSKFGRRKTIMTGILMLATAFGAASFLRAGSSVILMDCLFALAGIGWATINVNSYPMVVELSRGGDVGKYTGFYYTASMAAQTVTPILSGFFLDIKFTTLFPYATIFVCGSLITMFFVKHGDSKPIVKKDVLESLDVGD